MIEQFIAMATQQLNISQHDAEEATSGILSVLKGQSSESDFSQLLSQLDGSEVLMNKYSAGTMDGGSAGSGLMGSLMGAVSQAMGGSQTAQNLVGMAGLLNQINLDSGQLGSLATMFFEYVKGEAGEALAEQVMGGLGEFLQNKAA